jgi:hypothetical protein
MRQPPSPLLLSARKRRPRRNPPRGAQYGAATPASSAEPAQQQAAQSNPDEPCALLQRDSPEQRTGPQNDDDTPVSSR